jgi:hypothetical protein
MVARCVSATQHKKVQLKTVPFLCDVGLTVEKI